MAGELVGELLGDSDGALLRHRLIDTVLTRTSLMKTYSLGCTTVHWSLSPECQVSRHSCKGLNTVQNQNTWYPYIINQACHFHSRGELGGLVGCVEGDAVGARLGDREGCR